jgi:preprotein translocase SecE subunit
MAKARSPRIRKTETSGKLEKAKKSQKKRASAARGKLGSPLAKPFGFLGKILSKIVPGFLKGAFHEIRQTTWPTRSETIRLTWAVFVFAVIFSIIVAGLDFVLDKIFRAIILDA